MAKTTIQSLKTRFETGDKPTGQDFTDLIDTLDDSGALATVISSETIARQNADSSLESLKADKTSVYTKTETDSRIQAVVGAAPAALDTLQEIATQLQADESASSAIISELASKADITYVNDVISSLGGNSNDTAPIGAVMPFAGVVAPSGFLMCLGQSISRSVYSDLFAVIGTTFGSVDASSFNVPNLQGQFIRGLDGTNVIDLGRTLGSVQLDAQQKITGGFYADDSVFTYPIDGAFFSTGGGWNIDMTSKGDSTRAGQMGFDSSRVVRTAEETRPLNTALNHIIKYAITVPAANVIIPPAENTPVSITYTTNPSPLVMSQNDIVTIRHGDIFNENYSAVITEEVPGTAGLSYNQLMFTLAQRPSYFEENIDNTQFINNTISLRQAQVVSQYDLLNCNFEDPSNLDASPNKVTNWTVTGAGSTPVSTITGMLDTSKYKSGNKSLCCANAYITATGVSLLTEFTIDCDVFIPSSLSTTVPLFGTSNWVAVVDSTGFFQLRNFTGYSVSAQGSIPLDKWVHLRVIGKYAVATTLYLWAQVDNGVPFGGNNVPTATPTTTFEIGKVAVNGAARFPGWIDNLRIKRGVSPTTFTEMVALYTSLLPVMTSNSSAACTITSVGETSGMEAWRSIDGAPTVWRANNGSQTVSNPAWIIYHLAQPIYAAAYYIMTSNSSGGAFTLQGSNDGTSWTLLHTVSTDSGNNLYNIQNAGSYSYFKLNSTRGYLTNQWEISDFQLYGTLVCQDQPLLITGYPIVHSYVRTTDSNHFDLAGCSMVNSVAITSTMPLYTAINCFVSFDGRQTWKYTVTGGTWLTATNGLADLASFGSTPTLIQSALSNYIPKTGDLALDFAFSLSTVDNIVTPTITDISINYNGLPSYATQSVGSYTSGSEYGLRRVSGTATEFKKLSTGTNLKAYINFTATVNTVPTVITDVYTANSQVAMLALVNAKVNDVVVRPDIDKVFVLKTADYTALSSWVQLPGLNMVSSVNGMQGSVDVTAASIGAATTASLHTGAYKNITTSPNAPSGGSHGDVWIVTPVS